MTSFQKLYDTARRLAVGGTTERQSAASIAEAIRLAWLGIEDKGLSYELYEIAALQPRGEDGRRIAILAAHLRGDGQSYVH